MVATVAEFVRELVPVAWLVVAALAAAIVVDALDPMRED
jgi:hypothetical protein